MEGGRDARSAKDAAVGVVAEEREERIAKTCVGNEDISGVCAVGRRGASMEGGRCAHGSELGIVRSESALNEKDRARMSVSTADLRISSPPRL